MDIDILFGKIISQLILNFNEVDYLMGLQSNHKYSRLISYFKLSIMNLLEPQRQI
jgi:hypothetical protein